MFRLSSLLVIFLLLLSNNLIHAQDSVGILKGWTVESKRISEGRYELTFSGSIPANWQLYAPNQTFLDAPTTVLKFTDSSMVQDGQFAVASQPKKVKSNILENTDINVFENTASWVVTINSNGGKAPAKLQGTLYYTYGKGQEFYPSTELHFVVNLEGGTESNLRILIPTVDINNPVVDCGDTITRGSSYLTIFLLGLLGGFIALLTPCVFPMIPLTVSFFTNKSSNKRQGAGGAILYGFFIFLIYVLLTVPFHIAGKTNPDIFNNISTNVWLNLIFFAIFVLFALSFFGLYEITLPSGMANRVDSKSGIGNIGGIFFMALTLAIVSFSCTGPILGTLLAGVADGGAWPLTAGAAGFGIALGLPFAMFALFPNWLRTIPKSGGWMTDVKVVLGFVELALAVKFLANADNVKQWKILLREVFIAAWVVVGICIVLYLVGVIRVGHSTKPKRFGFARWFFILLFGAGTLYIIPGLFNIKEARLKLISGFPPPVCYSIYKNPVNCDKPLLDYEQALALSKKTNKPILIDFTGWACVNCRRMEEKVWTRPEVEKLMKEDFILVSLYVDERTKLPSNLRTVYTAKNGVEKSIVTIGDRWTAFQIDNFGATSQPQYAILSPDEKALVKTKFYTPDPTEFANWLKCGLDAMKKGK